MRTRPSFHVLAVGTALVVAATACDDAGSSATSEAPVAGTEVAVVDNDFEPAALEVEAGDTVTWTWEGGNQHDVAFDQVASEIQTGGTWTRTFDEPGEYDYLCTVHPNMQGTVVVTAS